MAVLFCLSRVSWKRPDCFVDLKCKTLKENDAHAAIKNVEDKVEKKLRKWSKKREKSERGEYKHYSSNLRSSISKKWTF